MGSETMNLVICIINEYETMSLEKKEERGSAITFDDAVSVVFNSCLIHLPNQFRMWHHHFRCQCMNRRTFQLLLM